MKTTLNAKQRINLNSDKIPIQIISQIKTGYYIKCQIVEFLEAMDVITITMTMVAIITIEI